MKKLITSFLISFVLFAGVYSSAFSQIGFEQEEEIVLQRWSIEARAGMMNPISPMSDGASTSLSSNLFNHFGLGFRYMFSEVLGMRVSGYFDNLKNGNDSRKFHTRFLTGSIQGIADLGKYLKITTPEGRFNLKGHLGLFAAKHDVLHDVPSPTPAGQPSQYTTERDGGFKLGLLPEFSLGKDFLLSFDLNLDISFRRHLAWDGLSWDGENKNQLTGTKWNFSVGFVYLLN